MDTRREKLAMWVKSLSAVQKILVGIIIAFVMIAILYQFEWSGFGKDENKSETTKVLINPRTGEKIEFTEKTTSHQSAKNLWDWLGLAGTIAIPIALFYFELREQRRSEKRSLELEEQAKGEKEIAEENAKREKEIADNNLREQALEAYIDRMSELLIDKKLKALISGKLERRNEDNVVIDAALDIARARTLSVLRRMDKDGERKSSVVLFLIDAELISYLDLENANLEGVNLKIANLEGVNLARVNLSFANLSFANLKGDNLIAANLKGTNLIAANLEDAILRGANLEGANLEGANLASAKLSFANLKGAINLTSEQVKKKAEYWELAIYNDEFRAELGLPPDK
ncbi:MAG: pentapeptide repeat-containing protein [Tolypothrix sp. Co-bin9]|nr:pentapeptide repeat-containing protein [Tolypothrix sp. Co-bin9]